MLLEVDTAPRTVETPADLERALSKAKSRKVFDGFSYSHRREFVDWVTSAKRAETRAARIPKVIAKVSCSAMGALPYVAFVLIALLVIAYLGGAGVPVLAVIFVAGLLAAAILKRDRLVRRR